MAPKQVEVSTLDVADPAETKQIISLAEGLAPVGGIYHLAMVLQDRWMSNQVMPARAWTSHPPCSPACLQQPSDAMRRD